ncbi:MAG: carboxypeptidase-like regulatory domain-containing protein [Acidobacteriota bacterium]
MAQTISSRFLFKALLCAAALTVPLVALTGRGGVGGRVVGRVIDRDSGLALAAELGLVIRDRRGITLKHVRASELGEFEIIGLPEGNAHLTTKLAGYAVEHESVALHSGETRQVEFRLLKAKTVQGVILDPAGQVLEGAQVRVIYADEETARDPVTATYQWEMGDAKSDAQGSFAVEVHPDKEFVIEATRPGYVVEVSEPKRIDATESSYSLRLPLSAGISVTGEARDEHGQMIPGALISLIEVEDRPELRRFTSAERLNQRTMQTVSGADGKFRFDQVRPARKTLIITHPRYQPTRQTLDITTERESQPTRVTLQRKQM